MRPDSTRVRAPRRPRRGAIALACSPRGHGRPAGRRWWGRVRGGDRAVAAAPLCLAVLTRGKALRRRRRRWVAAGPRPAPPVMFPEGVTRGQLRGGGFSASGAPACSGCIQLRGAGGGGQQMGTRASCGHPGHRDRGQLGAAGERSPAGSAGEGAGRRRQVPGRSAAPLGDAEPRSGLCSPARGCAAPLGDVPPCSSAPGTAQRGAEGRARQTSRFTICGPGPFFRSAKSSILFPFLQPLNLLNVAYSGLFPKLPSCMNSSPPLLGFRNVSRFGG